MTTSGKWLLPLALFLCGAAFAAPKPCELRRVAQIDVHLDERGIVYVPVSIDGHKGLMILQLGNGVPALYEGYVEELGLGERLRHTDWDITYQGKKIQKQARVGSTVLGNANFTGWDFQIYPLGQDYKPHFDGQPTFGVMTSVFMNAVDLELNLGAGRLNLFSPNACRGTPVYWDSEVTAVDLSVDAAGQLSFPMEVEGKLFRASLNTGSRLSVISEEATRRYLGFDADSPGVERQILPGDKEVATFRAMSLTAKGLDVKNSRVQMTSMPKCLLGSGSTVHGVNRTGGGPGIGCEGILARTPFSIGTDLMKRLRIYVSWADRHIYFTPAEAVPGTPQPASPAGAVTTPVASD